VLAAPAAQRFPKSLWERSMSVSRSFVALALLALCCAGAAGIAPSLAQDRNPLRSVSAFAGIQDRTARSRALFNEAAKVITNPRCMNCHPAGDHPLQGNDQHIHEPTVFRGESGLGVPGLSCAACHSDHNFDVAGATSYQSIPGHPRWGLAPIENAWEGKSIGQICEQIKDTKRNGGRDLELLYEHLAKDDLVGTAWHPGTGRQPAPGTQDEFGKLIRAWIDTGAVCPP
jgi:hypothetical protein